VQNENESSVFIQWLFAFGMATVFVIPAFLLRNFARRNNREGWVYFLVGLFIGFVGLELGKFAVLTLKPMLQRESERYLGIVLFVVAYLFTHLALRVVRNRIEKS